MFNKGGDLNAYTHCKKVLEPVPTRSLGRSSLSEQDKKLIQQHIGGILSQKWVIHCNATGTRLF